MHKCVYSQILRPIFSTYIVLKKIADQITSLIQRIYLSTEKLSAVACLNFT